MRSSYHYYQPAPAPQWAAVGRDRERERAQEAERTRVGKREKPARAPRCAARTAHGKRCRAPARVSEGLPTCHVHRDVDS